MAKSLKSSMKKAKEAAEKNTSITRKVGREEPVVVKSGTPLDHSLKHEPYEGAKLGMSKGITKNMDNYESLRVDVWLTDEVLPGESVREAYTRIEGVIDEVLEESVLATAGE